MTVTASIAAAAALAVIAASGSAAYAGYVFGATLVRKEWSEQRVALLRDHAKRLDQLMTKQAKAQRDADAVHARLTNALRSARNAPMPKITCPSTGDIRDAVVPGLADRLRDIDSAAASRHSTQTGMEVLPP